jgi:hypothetical protein
LTLLLHDGGVADLANGGGEQCNKTPHIVEPAVDWITKTEWNGEMI